MRPATARAREAVGSHPRVLGGHDPHPALVGREQRHRGGAAPALRAQYRSRPRRRTRISGVGALNASYSAEASRESGALRSLAQFRIAPERGGDVAATLLQGLAETPGVPRADAEAGRGEGMAAAGGVTDEDEAPLDHRVGNQRVARGHEGLLLSTARLTAERNGSGNTATCDGSTPNGMPPRTSFRRSNITRTEPAPELVREDGQLVRRTHSRSPGTGHRPRPRSPPWWTGASGSSRFSPSRGRASFLRRPPPGAATDAHVLPIAR
jgi:hypothetical protein